MEPIEESLHSIKLLINARAHAEKGMGVCFSFSFSQSKMLCEPPSRQWMANLM